MATNKTTSFNIKHWSSTKYIALFIALALGLAAFAPIAVAEVNPLDAALAGIGGQDALEDLSSFVVESSGTRWAEGEGFTPDEPTEASQFDTTTAYDLVADNLRVDTESLVTFLGLNTPIAFSEIIAGDLGYIDGTDSILGGEPHDMLSDRWAAIRKQQRLLNPHLILRDALADPAIVSDGGTESIDGAMHHILVVEDDVYPISLYVNANSGQIAKASTMENNHLLRDTPLEFVYGDWQPAEGGLSFPHEVSIVLGDHVIHQESRHAVQTNVDLDAALFEFPEDAAPVYDEALAERGATTSQFLLGFAAFGLPQDGVQTFVSAEEIAPGVHFLTGGSHNSMLVEQENGLVVVEAPLYNARSDALIAWIESEFPDTPITRVIASHFHDDHSGGLRAFVAAGATPVVSEKTADFYEKALNAPSTIVPDALALNPVDVTMEIVPADGPLTISDASQPIEVFHLDNAHADDMVITYLPNDEIVFIVDVYNPGFPALFSVVPVYDALQALGIPISTLVGGHGGIDPFAELEAQASQESAQGGDSLFSVPVVEISAETTYETQSVEVNGSQMAYVEAGEGDPILFIHGNPTSKYLWRNVMPWLEGQGRVIAFDLIGMGESDKPDIGYTFAEHSEYLEGFVNALELENVTLVIHDWGSGLGLDYAARHPDNVKGIAMMEAVVAPAMPASFATMPPDIAEFFQTMRTEGVGEELVLNQNMFVEQILPGNVIRGLTEAEMEHYRAPYPDPDSRLPILVWPRQVPIDGEPADVVARVDAYNEWLMSSTLPKLHIYVSPGALNPPEAVGFLSQILTNYETVYIGQGLHFIQEDHPEAIGRAVSDWYRRLPTMAVEQPAASAAAVEGLLPVPDAAFGPAVDQEKGYLVEEISDGLYWITDGTYNIIFLTTGEGVIVVDAPPSIGENIFKAIADVTDEPVTHLVYSHHHGDHIGAAALFSDDVTVIAHEETLALLERNTPCLQCLGPRPLPSVTFADSFTLEVGNQVLELEYRGVNHSPGNIFIYAPKQKVLMLVDVIFPGWVPFRSLAIAENVPGYIQAHVDALSFDFDTFVGGHLTRLGTRADVETAHEYILDVQDNMLGALQTVDLGATVGARGAEIGFEHTWELFGAYQDELNRVCTEETLAKWGDRLGDVAAFTPSHCEKIGDSLRVD